MSAVRWLCFAVLAACATGGMPNGNGSGDDVIAADAPATPPHDANEVTSDAPRPLDAPAPPDAFVVLDAPPPPPDAPASVFCTANNQCTGSGECCVRLGLPTGFCAPGIPIGSECLPQ